MDPIPINWLAVLAAAAIRFVVGALWYSPLLFVKPWQAVAGVTDEQLNSRFVRGIVVDAVMSLVMAFALANIIGASGITDWINGAGAGFWVWLGFIFATAITLWSFENRPLKLIAINTGQNLVALVLMGALLAVWR